MRDKLLFTPGPLTTSATVKAAMQRDVGSRDAEFIALVRSIRERLLALAGVSREGGYETVLVQGSGTFGIEAVISTAIPRGGRLLALVNGAYGARIAAIARAHGIALRVHETAEDVAPAPAEIERVLAADPAITHVSVVQCETTTGLMNHAEAIAEVAGRAGKSVLVDAMSAFGAVPLDLRRCGADFVVSSSNKCIEGVPGFSFVICRRQALLAAEGQARTLSLDLVAQWRGLEKDGQFRFTPPTHALLAFDRALLELDQEGGVAARARRYRANHQQLVDGMQRLGFRLFLPAAVQGYVISSFRYPEQPAFRFEDFYARLSAKGFVIYPGKLTHAACFRIGNIGRIGAQEIDALLRAIAETLGELGVALPDEEAASRRR